MVKFGGAQTLSFEVTDVTKSVAMRLIGKGNAAHFKVENHSGKAIGSKIPMRRRAGCARSTFWSTRTWLNVSAGVFDPASPVSKVKQGTDQNCKTRKESESELGFDLG